MARKQTNLTKSARGKECQVRIPGVCNFDSETVVLAHLNGAGMGLKHADIHGAYACSECHRVLVGGNKGFTKQMILLFHLEGMVRTQKIMLSEGLIRI